MQDQNMKRTSTEKTADLPTIPDKYYFTIGEVSELCKLKQHVLRYWEQEFPQLAPNRRGNRRYYERKDVLMVREIRSLLYEHGFTIEGARARLSTDNKEKRVNDTKVKDSLSRAISELEGVLSELESDLSLENGA